MKEADLILTPIPQANGLTKNRPAILLRQMPSFGDFLVCGVSTHLHQRVEKFDETISPSDADFTLSGLKSESLIRLGFLSILPRTKVIGAIGCISTDRHQRLLKTLSDYLYPKKDSLAD